MNTTAKRSHTHIKDPVIHVKSSVDYKNGKITWHALKVSIFKMLKLDAVQKKPIEENFPKREVKHSVTASQLGQDRPKPHTKQTKHITILQLEPGLSPGQCVHDVNVHLYSAV